MSNEIVIDPILPLPVVILLGAFLLALTVRVYWRVGASIGKWRMAASACEAASRTR